MDEPTRDGRSGVSEAPTRVGVSHRSLLALAAPMMVAHVTEPLLGIVDTAIIGQLGQAHLLGAVALGAVIFDFLFWAFGGLRLATAGLTAQAVGAGNAKDIDLAIARGLVLASLVGAAMIVLQQPIAAVAFSLAGASEAVSEALGTYFFVRILSAPMVLANYVILGSTLGRGRTDLGLLLQVGINLSNIALSVFFVMGLDFGVTGVAAGTVLAEAFGIVLGLLVLRRLGSNPFAVTRTALLARTALLRMLAVNRDILIRNCALVAAFAIFQGLGARAGDVTLAANAVLYNLFLLGSYFLDGFATAAEALCGQALGARDEGGFRRAARLAIGWSLMVGTAVSLAFLGLGTSFIAFITTNEPVRVAAGEHLVFAALTPLVGAAAFAFDGIFIGATWTTAMRNLMLAALGVYLALLALTSTLGNVGLWLAFLAFLGTRGLLQALFYPALARGSFGQAALTRSQ